MKDKRDREIATLTVEAAMLELHAEQLSRRLSSALPLSKQEKQLMRLASEESERAEAIRRRIHALRQPAA
jgi:hypothetical protein